MIANIAKNDHAMNDRGVREGRDALERAEGSLPLVGDSHDQEFRDPGSVAALQLDGGLVGPGDGQTRRIMGHANQGAVHFLAPGHDHGFAVIRKHDLAAGWIKAHGADEGAQFGQRSGFL